MVLLLILLLLVGIFFSMQNEKMARMKKEEPNTYKAINSLSYGTVFLILAVCSTSWWLITIFWFITVISALMFIAAIVSEVKAFNKKS
ncbi:MAG: hypothetical protein JSS64_07075 [Bacteroidetes bacterium]|nr:hypothetical protein [Bacteroidota bacterium]